MSRFDRSVLSSEVIAAIDELLAAARAEDPSVWKRIESEPRISAALPFVWYCSEFVAASCLYQPALLDELIASGELFRSIDLGALRAQLSVADNGDDIEPLAFLRRFRHRHMVRIAWRDLAAWANTQETLRDLSNLADACIQFAHDYAWREFCARRRRPNAPSSRPTSTAGATRPTRRARRRVA